MHSLIALDTQHHRLTESITWADNRASKYAELINKNIKVQTSINAQNTNSSDVTII